MRFFTIPTIVAVFNHNSVSAGGPEEGSQVAHAPGVTDASLAVASAPLDASTAGAAAIPVAASVEDGSPHSTPVLGDADSPPRDDAHRAAAAASSVDGARVASPLDAAVDDTADARALAEDVTAMVEEAASIVGREQAFIQNLLDVSQKLQLTGIDGVDAATRAQLLAALADMAQMIIVQIDHLNIEDGRNKALITSTMQALRTALTNQGAGASSVTGSAGVGA